MTKNKVDFFGNKLKLIKITDKQIERFSDEKIDKMILKEIGKVDFFVILGALWHHLYTKGSWDLMVDNEKIISNILKLRNAQVDRNDNKK